MKDRLHLPPLLLWLLLWACIPFGIPTSAFSGSIRNTSVPLLIGRRSGKGVDGHRNGVIGVTDEVRLYSRALADMKLRTLFNAGSERKCSLKVGG
jgi:hypothetical protein